MSSASERMLQIGEPFAAGLLELGDVSVARIFCRGYRRFYETCPLRYNDGEPLFPNGVVADSASAVVPMYFLQYGVKWDVLESKSQEACNDMRIFAEKYNTVGGWNHSALNFRRILKEGINGYEERVCKMKDDDLRESLLDVLCGIRTYIQRSIDFLRQINAPERLIAALERVPLEPAKTAYEALVSINFMLSLDEWDNVGRVDSYLVPYHQGEDLTKELHCMMKSMQDNNMWSITIGPDYNDITRQILLASKGLARPMVQLRVVKDMPEDIWELAVERILEGGGQPSFYNEDAIQRRLRERLPNAPTEDLLEFIGGGCTETCLEGLTFCGGVDLNLNVLKVLEKVMEEKLCSCSTFEAFYDLFLEYVRKEQDAAVKELNRFYNERKVKCFAPIRTLFTEDCIGKELGYFQGGARYTYAVPSDSGIPNSIDSLLAIKTLVFEKKLYSAEEFLCLLHSGEKEFKIQLRSCPCYGVADSAADDLLHEFTKWYYSYYRHQKLDLGDGIFPTAHQFTRHIEAGEEVDATPDGRESGEPVSDSIAAVNGKAVQGPTRLLLSAARYHQEHIYAIPVLNLSVTRKYDPTLLRALIEGYFSLNGTQIQITAATKEKLLAAKKEPDKHRDLIVRVGGFSDFFWKLSDELQDAVVARTMYE